MKTLKIVILSLIFSTLLVACSQKEKTQNDLYFSISATSYDNGVSPEGGMTTANYFYDIKSKELKQIGDVNYTSQYPLSVYSKEENIIYYVTDDGKNCDQLFYRNVNDNEVTQLTHEFFAINYIIPRENDILIVGRLKKERVLKPFIYNKVRKELKELQVGFDFQCWMTHYNPVTGLLLLEGYSYAESERLREEFNESQEEETKRIAKRPKTYFYQLNQEELQLIFAVEKKEVARISSDNQGSIVYGYRKEAYSSTENNPIHWDSYTDEDNYSKDDNLFGSYLPIVYAEFYYNTDDTIYFLGYEKEEGAPYGIYQYNPKKDEMTLIIDAEKDLGGYINNFMMLSHTSN